MHTCFISIYAIYGYIFNIILNLEMKTDSDWERNTESFWEDVINVLFLDIYIYAHTYI